ncbi:hypothetical protein BVX99_01315 [bacterium F16]|nr:hypothetical protein BVX99_01315 [bacterium F16]
MIINTGQSGDETKISKRAVSLFALLVFFSFIPLALEAFFTLNTNNIPADVYTKLTTSLYIGIFCVSTFIPLLALCMAKRGINKPELWLSILFGLIGFTFLGCFWIKNQAPAYLQTWRLTIEHLVPVMIACHLGILGPRNTKYAKAFYVLIPALSLIIMLLAYVNPTFTDTLLYDFIPIHNPYDLLPLILMLSCAFYIYPNLARNYGSFTLQSFWAATAPATCGIILSLFSPPSGKDYAFLFTLVYIFLSRAIIICGLLGDFLKREQSVLSLEKKLSEQDRRISKYKARYQEKKQVISQLQIDFAETAFYHAAFQKIFENVQAIGILLSPAGKVIAANPFTKSLLNLPDDLTDPGFSINDLLVETDMPQTGLSLLDSKEMTSQQICFRKIHSTESVDVNVTITGSHEDDSPDDISCVLLTASDSRLQQQLKDENLRLKWQMSVTPSPIVEFSPEGDITFQNEPATLSKHVPSAWQHPLLKNIKPALNDLKSGKLQHFDRQLLCEKRYFQQTLTYNPLFNRFVLHSLDITESGKRLAENEKVVNYAAWLQQQFCIHYNEPYNLLNLMLKKSVEWLNMSEAVICTENDGRLTRIAAFPDSAVRTGTTDPHSEMLMQMLTSVPAGPFEIPTEETSLHPCMGYHLNINEKPWGVIYFMGSSPSADRRVKQNILGNIGTWMTLVISQTNSSDVATRQYYLSPTPMFTCVANGKIKHANTAFERVFDIHEDSVSSHTLQDFLSSTDKGRLSEFLTIPVGSWMSESVVYMETRERKPTPFRLFCTADPLTEQLFCILVAEKAANGQKALGYEGMARIGKEISNPLSCVVGMTELLEGSGLDIRQRNFIDQIRQSADTLLGLSETINDYSLLRSGDLELNISQFDLQDLLEIAFSSFENEAASKTVSMFLHYSPQTPRCFWGDRERIGSIFRNLIGNAVHFTEVGYVSVIVQAVESSESSTNTIRITIEDSGSGIPSDQLSEIFSEHSTVSRNQHYSCGLGLTTAKELATLMNGNLSVDSTLGQGTIFTLNLQIQPAPALQDSQTTVCELNIRRAMLLMGDPMAMQVISTTLNEAALEKETYTEPVVALNALQEASESGNPFNLLIVDEDMRNPDAEAFAQMVKDRSTDSNIKLIKYSADGYRSRGEREEGLFEETILSPVTPQRILRTIRRVYSAGESEHPLHSVIPEQTLELHRTISILLADPDTLNRDIIRGLLEHSTSLVDISADGARTVELACRHKYDIIFMVIDLPNMDGYEVTRAIRKVESGKRHTPIVAILQADDPKIRKHGRNAGIDTFITKPVRRRNLNRILHEFIIEAAAVNTTLTLSQTETVDLYPLEIDKAATAMGVKKKLYVRIIRMFTDSLDEHLKSFLTLFEKKDYSKLSLAARKLGRSSANLHLFELKNSCLKLEELADSGEWDAVLEQITSIRKLADQLKEFAQNLPS